MIKRFVVALLMAVLMVPIAATAASAQPNRVACLFYQTFAERDITDCLN